MNTKKPAKPVFTMAKFAELQKAESIGSHINKHFVRTKHKFTKQDK